MNHVQQLTMLRDQYGDQIILFDEQDESTVFRILSEFIVEGQEYAVLQSDELKKEDEVAIFRMTKDAQGLPELETIEDDDEWENVSEIYDELSFPMQLDQ
jgi:uncharacterized protein YrzB (UPF0473 family)